MPPRNSQRMWTKVLRIRLRYEFKRLAPKAVGCVMPSLFLLTSLALITLVLFPGLKQRLRESAFLSRGSETLVISGTVRRHQLNAKGKDLTIPAEGVIIDVGGFRAATNEGGKYELRFTTRAREHIPVVLHWNQGDRVERIAFPCGDYRVHKDFVIK